MTDYIIAVDENGQAYIAHAKGEGSWLNRVVKYVQKVPIGNGKFRYIYNTAKRKAKTAAKMAWGSKAGRFIDEHDAGITERIMANRLSRKSKRASKKGYHDDAMAYSRRSSELRKESRDEWQNSKLNKLISSGRKGANNSTDTNPVEYKPTVNRPTSHQKNVTGTAKEGWSNRRNAYGIDDLHNLHEDYVKKEKKFSSVDKSKRISGQEKQSNQRAMKKAETEYNNKKDKIVGDINQIVKNTGYEKKKNPQNSSHVIGLDVLIKDAEEAGVPSSIISEFKNAKKAEEKAYRKASQKFEESMASGRASVVSLYTPMPYDDPEYKEATRKSDDLEEILRRVLYK